MTKRESGSEESDTRLWLLRRARAECLLVQNTINIRYMTGVEISAGYLLIHRRGMNLYLDARYFSHIREKNTDELRMLPIADFAQHLQAMKTCALESGHTTVEAYERLKRSFRNTRFTAVSSLIEEKRRRKSAREIAAIERACRITKAVLKTVPSLLHIGVTERDLAWKIRSIAHEKGADDLAFETIVAFGRNTAFPHHRPSDAQLRQGDVVQIDMGAKCDGYCSDFSRVYFTDKPTAEQRKAYRAIARTLRVVRSAIRAGKSGKDMDDVARKELKKDGYGEEFCHALGHGVGLEIHEGILLSGRGKNEKIKMHEAVAIEPGLYFLNKWGMRLEETVIIRN